MLVHIDASDRAFTHADPCCSIARDQAAEKLEHIGIVPDEKNILAICVFVDKLLEFGVTGAAIQRRADLDSSFIAEFVADELRRLKSALQRARDNDVRLDFQSAKEPAHQHALFLAFRNKTAFSVKLRAITWNAGIGMPHEVKVHGSGG